MVFGRPNRCCCRSGFPMLDKGSQPMCHGLSAGPRLRCLREDPHHYRTCRTPVEFHIPSVSDDAGWLVLLCQDGCPNSDSVLPTKREPRHRSLCRLFWVTGFRELLLSLLK